MKRFVFIAIGLAALMFLASPVLAQTDDEIGWVQFRGPNGSGLAPESMSAPLTWSSSENLVWKSELPGLGSSCPIFLDGKLFLTSYTGYGVDKEAPGEPANLERHLICLDTSNGKERWRSTVKVTHAEDPYQGFIQEHGYASSTPATDGTRIYTFFGKDGVYAFDLDGKQLWNTNVGTKSDPAKWGGAASCVVVDGIVVVNAGIEGHAIVGLDAATGEEKWRVEDPGFTNSWATPVIVEVDGHKEAVVSMPGKVVAVDPANGKQLWTATSPVTQTTCPSLAVSGDLVIATGGRGGQAIAIRCGGSGDVSDTHTVWKSQLPGGIGTPVVVGNRMYWGTRGIAYCANVETGEKVFEGRLAGEEAPKQERGGGGGGNRGGRRGGGPAGDYASPIAIGNHIYITMRNGTVYVIEAGDQLKVVASNSFNEDAGLYNATPAAVDGRLYIRAEKALYCVGQ